MKKLVILSLCLFMTLTVRSQSWRAAADSLIVNHVLANAIGKVDIYVFPEPLTSTDSITLYDGSKIPIPYSNCYCYFIDIMPSANWSHPCKYCFVNASLRHTSVSANMPPARDDIIGLSLYARPNPNPMTFTYDTTFVRNCKSSDTNHKWAVLIDGNGCETRFWFDLSSVYTVLTNVYGYQEGSYLDNFAKRRIIVTAPEDIRKLYKEVGKYTSDLNGNGSNSDEIGDFFHWSNSNPYTSHTRQNIRNIFRCFAGDSQCPQQYVSENGLRRLTEEDQLFIYHGMLRKAFPNRQTGHCEIITFFAMRQMPHRKETFNNKKA